MERDFRAVAQSWLDGNYDDETKAEVRKLMDTDPAGLEDAFYRNLEFGTGGLRGVMGVGTNRMNKYVVAMATQGLDSRISPRKSCRPTGYMCISMTVSIPCRFLAMR